MRRQLQKALLILAAAVLWPLLTGFRSGDDRQLYIVVLKEPALAQKVVQWTPGRSWAQRKEILFSEAASEYRKGVELGQLELARKFVQTDRQRRLSSDSQSLEVVERRSLLLNSMLVRANPAQVEMMRQMPEVRGVYRNREVELLMDSIPEHVGAPQAWMQVGGLEAAGEGIRIAIVDSGIDVQHPMFQDDSLTPPAGFPQPADFAQFTNSKVIVARNYVRREFGDEFVPEFTPEDKRGHGSIVAGVAAGAPTMAPLGFVRGIAPRAFLGNYRVFGDPSLNPTATDAAVVAAMEDAVSDGMDVINLSLGGQARNPERDPEQITIANAMDLGVVVIVAAGNSGRGGAGTVTSPGTSPAAVTVGSTSHPRIFGNSLQVVSSADPVPPDLQTMLQVPGNGSSILTRTGPIALTSIVSLDASELACPPSAALPDGTLFPPGSLVGKTALVRRGQCFFAEKAANVFDRAGAAAMVVYNNIEGSPIRMDFGENPPTRPAVMIERERGVALRDFFEAGGQPQVIFGPLSEVMAFPGRPDLLSDFSGRGPSIDLGIKPDVSGPGENIYSAFRDDPATDGTDYSNPSGTRGTSFSTPIVAGGAALLLQAHPDWSAYDVKSALVNTAQQSITFEGRPARNTEAGAGRVDLARAISADAVVDPVSISFGVMSDLPVASRSLELANLDSEPRTFTLEVHSEGVSGVEVFATPGSLTLDGGERAELVLNAFAREAPGEFEGHFEIRQGDQILLQAPYWGIAQVAGKPRTLSVSQTSNADYFSLETALRDALPGDVVEILDSAAYAGNLTIQNNGLGLPLNGLTLRAAPGQNPAISSLEDGDSPAIRVVGLEQVLLEGLTVRSRGPAVVFEDAGGVVKDNRLIFESPGEAAGVTARNSRVHVYGNTISGFSEGIALEGAGLVQHNRIVDVDSGVSAQAIPVSLFDNRIENALTDAFLFTAAPALVKGNSIVGRGGIRGTGSPTRLTIRDNWISGSGGHAVQIQNSAQAFLSGNRLDNSLVGLQVTDAAAASYSDQFFGNGVGARVDSSGRLQLENALVAGGADGIVANQSSLSIFNSTIADHTGSGLAAEEAIEVSAFNSIFFGNAGGNRIEAETATFSFNLFESETVSGEGNFPGDPVFADPAAFDYSPGAGSEAIDRGSADFAPAEDLLFHRRPVDGDGDGLAGADLGAVESGSASAPSIILPILTTAREEFLGLALANASSAPATLEPEAIGTSDSAIVTLRAFNAAGQPFGQLFQVEIPPGRQVPVVLDEILGPLTEGWVEILPTQRDLKSFTLAGHDLLYFLDGAQLDSRLRQGLLFPEIRNGDGETRLFVVNPHDVELEVRFAWLRPDGGKEENALTAAPRGVISTTFQALFGSGAGGYVTAQAELPIYGVELFGDADRRGGLLALDLDGGTENVFAAQLASTNQIETEINVVNLGGESSVRFVARAEDGSEMASAEQILGAGGWLRMTARQLFGFQDDAIGWLELRSSGRLLGNISFGDPQGRFLAALPLQSAGSREFLLSHVAQTSEIFTGVTLLNATSQTALATLEVFRADGSRQGIAFLELGPGEKMAKLLPELIEGFSDQSGGFVRVRSNQPLMGFELFGNLTLNFLSAVPQQSVVD